MPYTVIDHRTEPKTPPEACRVCGAPTVHTKNYNQPTMDCIRHLRSQLIVAQTRIVELETVPT